MGSAEKGCDTGCKGRGGAGPDSLNIVCVTEIETSEAVGGVCGETVDGVGLAGAAGAPYPSTDGCVAGTVGVASARSGKGIKRSTEVAVVGESDGARRTGGSLGGVLGAG